MFKRTPRRSGGRSGNQASRGLFESGQWFCDCEPRLPAVHLQTKKKGNNQGRWFYTCQQERKKQCGFFMWEDAAQGVEKEYLFNGGRQRDEAMISTHIGPSSPPLPAYLAARQQLQRDTHISEDGRGFSLPTVSTGDEMDFMSHADRESQRREMSRVKEEEEEADEGILFGGGGASSGKRKRGLFVDDSDGGDEFGGTELNSDEERELVALAEGATPIRGQTQSQSQRWTEGELTTPSAQRSYDVLHGLPTPNTRPTVQRNSLLIAGEERGAKRQRTEAPATPSSSSSLARPESSGPSTTKQRSEPSASASSSADDRGIVDEVMALLDGVPMLDEGVARSVRRKLEDYAARMRSVRTGRDLVRSIVQTKEARIAELQARVAQLEKDRLADKDRIKKLAAMVAEMS